MHYKYYLCASASHKQIIADILGKQVNAIASSNSIHSLQISVGIICWDTLSLDSCFALSRNVIKSTNLCKFTTLFQFKIILFDENKLNRKLFFPEIVIKYFTQI